MSYLLLCLLLINIPAFSFEQVTGETKPTGIVFGQSLIPDYTFKGSNLKGLSIIGPAEWKAHTGELIGKANPGTDGGWLFLDRSYQNRFHALCKSTEDNQAGVMFRR